MDWEQVKRARERLKGERGTVFKDWGGRLPFALVYPNTYEVGMSSLGFQTIYRLLSSRPDIVCERVFYEPDGEPLSLESQRPLNDFAVIAFSVSFELDYLNIPAVLKRGGVPLYAAERDETHPLIIGGGACIMTNPLPVAPFFDCLAIGEAEPVLPRLLPVLSERLSAERKGLLGELSRLPGTYVPQKHTGETITRQWAENLDEFPAGSAVLTADTELGDMYLLEVERGCGWGCRFCLVSTAFRPMRFRSMESLIAQAQEGLKLRKRLGLVGPAVAAHPQIEEICERLRGMGAGLSVSSLRVKPFSMKLLETLAASGAESITLAPEAGSERLRQAIRKGISEDDILRAVDAVARSGIKSLKLYFMVGLPGETDDDVTAAIGLLAKCRAIIEKGRTGCRISVNFSPFVPKAGTPFERQPMAAIPVLESRLARLRNALAGKGVKVKSESPAWSEVQAVLSRGDSALAGAIAGVAKPSLAGWRRAMHEAGIDVDFYAHRGWEAGYKLPWSFIHASVA